MDNKKKPDEKTHYMPLGMCMGMSLGMAVGAAMGNMMVGMSTGLCIGMAIGAILDSKNKKDSDAAEADGEDSEESAQ